MSTVIMRDAGIAPRDHARWLAEYAALTQRAGAIIQPDLGILRVEGSDRADWLHNLVTTDVEKMREGGAAYSLLLEAKAHILADFVLVKQAEYFLLYTSAAAHKNLYSNLRRAIFREKVLLSDVSAQFGIISVQGPQAAECLSKSFQPPISNLQHPTTTLSITQSLVSPLQSPLTNHQLLLIPNPRIPTRFDIVAPRDDTPDLNGALTTNGADPINLDSLTIVRVEAGIPQYGDDFDETTLAPEARLETFIAPDKGCYPGQETIARIRNLGHVNRLLVQLQIANDKLPDRGDKILVAEKEIGEITSVTWSFAHDAPLALGYTRREFATAGTRVQIVHGDAQSDAVVLA